ncbi:MAG: tRNA (guanosine(37)-N1)-methyltransferase TrmD [Oscillospiraceae bacterium]|jgi:tRNA (guanine37-N1)-methyltransferase|nr:tRNA (guanosine(37)-N1)-methyltransferase TrmD [Oscillospiraceae bacterium]
MNIKVLTIFPQMFAALEHSIVGRAIRDDYIGLEVINIRDFSEDKHRKTDDYPYGGGSGMVMTAQPIISAMEYAARAPFEGRRIYMSPRGERLTQRKAERLARMPGVILLCGHYEGVDERALAGSVDEEISIGDYILTGGEPAAIVVIDAITRLIPGVLGNSESSRDESFGAVTGLLEYPQYTHPREINGMAVPEVLLSGDHARIAAWRRYHALRTTWERRRDLLADAPLHPAERNIIAEWEKSEEKSPH